MTSELRRAYLHMQEGIEPRRRAWRGWLIDFEGIGSARVSDEPGKVYVRIDQGQGGEASGDVVTAHARIRPVPGWAVWIGTTPYREWEYTVLDVDDVAMGGEIDGEPVLEPHHETHEWGSPSGSDDVVYPRWIQLYDFGVWPTQGWEIRIGGGVFDPSGTIQELSTTFKDLSTYVPAYGQLYVTVALSATGTIELVPGQPTGFLTLDDIPDAPSDQHWELAAVRLRAGDPGIVHTPRNPGVIPLHFSKIGWILANVPTGTHAPVTLSTDLDDNLLDIDGQELDLDLQPSGGLVFAAPEGGGKPAFIQLTDPYIPDIHDHYPGIIDLEDLEAGARVDLHEAEADPHSPYLLASGARAGASSQAQDFGSNGVKADTIVESTGDAGVTIETVPIEDGLVDGLDLSELGERIFTQDDLLLLDFQRRLLLGTGATTGNYLIGSRLEQISVLPQAAVSGSRGALHFEPSIFPRRRALVIDPAIINIETNPSFETGTTGWTAHVGATVSQSSDVSRFGIYSLKVITAGNAYDGVKDTTISCSAATDYTGMVWIYRTEVVATIRLNVRDDVDTTGTSVNVPATLGWSRVSVTHTTGAGAATLSIFVQNNNDTTVETFYIDGIDVVEADYPTTHVDGDQGDGYSWNSTPHASTSTRVKTEINLDDYIDRLVGKTQITFRTVIRAPSDADGTDWQFTGTFQRVVEIHTGSAYRVWLSFYTTTQKWVLALTDSSGTTNVITDNVATFERGDWIDLIWVVDYSGTSYIYENGSLVGSGDTSSRTNEIAATDQFNLGDSYGGIAQAGWWFAEFVLANRAWSAAEIAAIHALKQPLIDVAALENRQTVNGVNAGRWQLLGVPAYKNGSGGYTEFSSYFGATSDVAIDYRVRFAGSWAAGDVYFEATGFHSGAGSGYIKLQYYDGSSWRDVPGGVLSYTALSYVRKIVGPLAVPQQEFTYRIVGADDDIFVACNKAAILVAPGHDLNL